MRTTKEIFNSNLEENITFEYFSPDGYRVYSEEITFKSSFEYKTKHKKISSQHTDTRSRIKVKLHILDNNATEKIKCPLCKKEDYITIEKVDTKTTKYTCKNKSCNISGNITYKITAENGDKVYSEKRYSKSYFYYSKAPKQKSSTNIDTTVLKKVILEIEDINTVKKIKCPECKKDDYIKIQKSDGKNTKYACKNKSCNLRFFRYLPTISTKTLDNLVKSHFNISSIKKHQEAYSRYITMQKRHQRIEIADEDIQYLEHYLLLGIPRDLIAQLFSISTRTLRRFIKQEELLEKWGKSRFKKTLLVESGKKLKIHKIIPHDNILKSEIQHSYTDFTKEDYETYVHTKYHIKSKTNYS